MLYAPEPEQKMDSLKTAISVRHGTDARTKRELARYYPRQLNSLDSLAFAGIPKTPLTALNNPFKVPFVSLTPV